MHPNPSFRRVEQAETLKFIRAHGFATLSINGNNGPLLAHVPFWVDETATRVEAHLARSNPILRAIKDAPQKAVLSIMGPHSYISPDWYEIDDQVPTWNYVAAHLCGDLTIEPGESLPDHLNRLSNRFEDQLEGPNWTMDKVDPEALNRMLRMIVPISMSGISIEATWKLGQNKDTQARQAAGQAVRDRGIGNGLSDLAELMLTPPKDAPRDNAD